MAMTLDTSCIEDFAASITKAVSPKPSPSGVTVGYEWEIPIDTTGLPSNNHRFAFNDDDANQPFSQPWLRTRGFNGHYDCGGREVGSPIFNNLGTARRFARFLQDQAAACDRLLPDETTVGNTGIHVHVTHLDGFLHPNWDTINLSNFDRRLMRLTQDEYFGAGNLATAYSFRPEVQKRNAIWLLAVLIANRNENSRFFRSFSQRTEGRSYSSNAKVNGWDTADSFYYGVATSGTNNAMMKPNMPGSTPTLEFRIWKGISERLIPAIEFSHSYYRWVMKVVDTMGMDTINENLYTRTNNVSGLNQRDHDGLPFYLSGNQSRVQLNEFVPHMSDYFTWLKGVSGYKNLKRDEHVVPYLA